MRDAAEVLMKSTLPYSSCHMVYSTIAEKQSFISNGVVCSDVERGVLAAEDIGAQVL